MWQLLLEGGESSQFAWRQILGGELASLQSYLTATGRFADFVPCGQLPDCGWRVRSEQGVGRCPEGECPSREFSRSELAMVDVDWPRLFGDLALALGLDGSPDTVGNRPVAVQLGWIAPAQSARFPAFFCVPMRFLPPFPMIQRCAERAAGGSFVLVIASRDWLDTDCLGLLHRRKAEVVFLDEDVRVDGSGRIEAGAAADRILRFALAAGGVSTKPELPKFPTPPGAQWQDFTIVEIDGATVEFRADVRAGNGRKVACERYLYENLGLQKTINGTLVFTADGEFFHDIISHRRVFRTESKDWDSLRGYRKRVGALLEKIM